ncbi:MAG: efflux RND transporter periplasmic adaptor subunit [Bacteroidota bacterium]
MNGERVKQFVVLPQLAVLALACGRSDDPQLQPSAESTLRPVNVNVTTIALTPFVRTINIAGTVKALEDVMVSPEEGGVLAAWKVERGAHVRRGTVIGLLNDDVIKASSDAATAQFRIAELNFQKQEKVYAEQGISELQYKSSGYSRDAAKAQADLMQARLRHTRLTSPIDGILDDRFVDEGEMAAPGVPVARIVNIATVKIQASVPERHAGAVQRGARVTFRAAALPGREFLGKVSFIGATLSADNKTFLVEALVPNPGALLKPEMVGHAAILRAARGEAILIPEETVLQVDKDRLVVFVEEHGKARERVVLVGEREGSLLEIISGLSAGERLITAGFRGLVDGQPVIPAQ